MWFPPLQYASMKLVTSLSVLLACATGCASAPETVAADAPKQECTRVYRVGSNVPIRECTTGVSEEERQRTIDEWRNAVRPAPARANPGGGG